MRKIRVSRLLSRPAAVALAALSLASLPGAVAAADGAEALMKENKCTSCHHPSRTKKGPSLKKIADKYKGDAAAAQKLVKHFTVPSMVKIEGEDEEHDTIKTTKDARQLNELAAWILAR